MRTFTRSPNRLALFLALLLAPAVFAVEPPQERLEESACSALIAQVDALVERAWVDKKFSAPFLRQLVPLSDERLQSEFGFEPDLVHSAAKKFQHQNPHSEPLAIHHLLAERVPNHQLSVLFIMRANDELVGFLALIIERKEGVLEAWSEFMKVDRSNKQTRGISYSYTKFIAPFYRELGVAIERIEAGWVGRSIWAKAESGYGFDPEANLQENGVALPQTEVIRRNFERFLQHHAIRIEDLYVGESSPLGKPLRSLSELKEPADFLAVRHSAGPIVRVTPYIDVDTLGPETLAHPGLAFCLWDYRPRTGQTVSIDQNGKPLSDIAMPTWIGIRYLAKQ